MNWIVKIITWGGFVLFSGVVIYILTLFAPYYATFFPFLYNSFGSLLLWGEFNLVLLITIFSSVNMLKWKSITYWFFSVTLCVIIFLCSYSSIEDQMVDIMWTCNKETAWIVTKYIIWVQCILFLSYSCFHLLLSPFHNHIEKVDIFSYHILQKIPHRINALFNTCAINFKEIAAYVKVRKYLFFTVCEILAFFVLLITWLFGFSPILVIAMLSMDYGYDYEIVFGGHIILMSVTTIFFASNILKMSRWYIWGFALFLCIMGGLLLLQESVIDIENAVINHGITALFCSCLFISQAILLSIYCTIAYLTSIIKEHD